MNSGLHQFDLPVEERPAGERLLRRRRAVAGRTPIDDVGDVNVGFGEADRFQHLVEQLPGAADERLAFEIFVAARRFADDHQPRRRRAAIKAELAGRCFERAAVERAERRFKRFKRVGCCGRCGGRRSRLRLAASGVCGRGGRRVSRRGASVRVAGLDAVQPDLTRRRLASVWDAPGTPTSGAGGITGAFRPREAVPRRHRAARQPIDRLGCRAPHRRPCPDTNRAGPKFQTCSGVASCGRDH